MKKRNKKEDKYLIDLNARGSIRIVHSAKTTVSYEEMQEFEKELSTRYTNYCEFTDLCIKKNMEKNSNQVSKQVFIDAMKSMLEQNKLLEDMINIKEHEY